MIPISKRYQNLINRRTDIIENYVQGSKYLEKTATPEIFKYIFESMQPVDLKYTNKTYEEAERIINHLNPVLDKHYGVEFKFQGSVTNNTHIKFYSDIDILPVITRYFTLQPPLIPSNPYEGNPIEDLLHARYLVVETLEDAFPKADIDNAKSKCVNISGGSLQRSIDVVPANWYHTVDYVESNDNKFRGIQILDLDKMKRIENFPFLHNSRLEAKNRLSNGGLKKLIRCLKNIKADENIDIEISSYDIAGLVYNMDLNDMTYKIGEEAELFCRFYSYSNTLYVLREYGNNMMVPNNKRKLFCEEGLSFENLRKFNFVLKPLVDEINQYTRGLFNEVLSLSNYS